MAEQPKIIEGENYFPEGYEVPEVSETSDMSRSDAYFNVYNPYFGIKFRNEHTNAYNPMTRTWTPEQSEWASKLTPDEKVAVSNSRSEEHAKAVIERRRIYQEAQAITQEDSGAFQFMAGMGTGMLDPTIAIPVGVTYQATKAAYTTAAKATRLLALSGESAVASMASASTAVAAEKGSGYGGNISYGTANLYAGLLGGGLPIIGRTLSAGYTNAKVAAGLTKDPKNFLALTGELTADQLGGTQLRSIYSKVVPKFLQSDVSITASSDNKMITLISNRIDSPSVAIVDRNTGKPIPIGTTGQDYKTKFNGRARLLRADLRGLQSESTIKDLDTFHTEVGKVVRDRAVKQENAVYTAINEEVTKAKQERAAKEQEEMDLFTQESFYYRDEEGKLQAVNEYTLKDIEDYNVAKAEYETKKVEADEYVDTLLKQYQAEGLRGKKNIASKKKELVEYAYSHLPEAPVKPKVTEDNFIAKGPTKAEVKAFQEELMARLDEELEARITKFKEETYNQHQFEFEHKDPKVVEAAKKIDEYYKKVLEEGKKLKIHELKHIGENRHYMTRIFDFQAIKAMSYDQLVQRLHRAIEGHVANKDLPAEKIAAKAQEMATKLKELEYDRNFADWSMFVPKELGSTAYIKSKRLKFDDRAIEDLLVTNIEDVVGQYSYSQAGHFAANHAFPELQGIPRDQQLDVFKDSFVKKIRESSTGNKLEEKEIEALTNMFNDLLGTYRIAKNGDGIGWKATRIANSINSLTYGGGFALNTAAEIGGLLLDGHVKNVMKNRIGAITELKHMFNGKTIEDPMVRDFILMGQFENLVETSNLMKLSDTDAVFNVNKLEHNLNKVTSEFFKYVGLRGATVALESMVGPKIIHDIMDLAMKPSLSVRHQKYLARIGLSHEDAKAIKNHLDAVGEFTDTGKIYNLNLDKWDDALLDKITTATSRGIKHTIIKGDSTYLPHWMINPNTAAGFMPRLVFQFLRYPLAASETLMARGMDESMARWTAATMTSTFLMSMVMYGREQAAIAAGLMPESEAKFDNFTEDSEAAMKLFTTGFAKAGTLGGMSILADRFSALSGVPLPGSEYADRDVLGAVMGPTFSRLPQLRDLLEPMLTEGVISSKQQWFALKGMMPGATAPFISEYLSTQIKEKAY